MLSGEETADSAVFQRARTVTKTGVMLSPSLPAATLLIVVLSAGNRSLPRIIGAQVIAAILWGSIFTALFMWSVSRRLARAKSLPVAAQRRDDATAIRKTVKWQIWLVIPWCALVIALGPAKATVGYMYAAPLVTLLLHCQITKWVHDHRQTIWWKAGLVGRREYFLG